ncbi:MAG: GxxExxY protein [Candidatus Stahlbacteria bacterium]|nr:MAG: GxxExxY protein [Candidatus Stahlbacteria bacterium]
MRKEERDPVTEEIIAACYRIHNELGPGFTEKIYSKALQIALEKTDLKYETEKDFSVSFDSIKVGKFRADFVIADSVIVELKSVEGKLPKIFESQVISYLKASGLQVGLLVNFGNRRCEIRRLMV